MMKYRNESSQRPAGWNRVGATMGKKTSGMFRFSALESIIKSTSKRTIVTSRTVGLNAEQVSLLNMAEEFAKKELTPYAAEVVRSHACV